MASADSFLAVYLAHRDDLLKYASRIVHDRASAEDLVQEAWLRFSVRPGQGGEVSQPKSYLYKIVRNLALDWLRRTSRSAPQSVTDDALESIPSDVPSAEQVLYYRDELRQVESVLSELPERTQIAFVMYRVEKRSLQEIGKSLGISAVRVHKIVRDAVLYCSTRMQGTED